MADLPVAAAPVEHPTGVLARDAIGDLDVLAHLRARAQVHGDVAGVPELHGLTPYDGGPDWLDVEL